jgi:acetyl esterase
MDLQHPSDKSHDGSAGQAAELSEKFGGRKPDAEMAAVLRVLMASDAKPFYELTPKLARRHPLPPAAVETLLRERGEDTDPEEVGDVDNRKIDGPGGHIHIRIYKPASAAVDTLLPIVFYIHGGGWVIADLDTYDSSARAVCNRAHCIVVSSHYRQGPEDKYPAAHDDTYAAYQWTIANALELGGDPSRIAIVGESAGGNMAASICIRARDNGVPLPVHQVLVYPVVSHDMTSESYREMTQAVPLNSAAMAWFFEQYVDRDDDNVTDDATAHTAHGTVETGAAPIWLDLADLSGTPPVTIINAELDPLRSEGEALAERYRAAGVHVQQRTFAGVTHEFFGMSPVLEQARGAQEMAAIALRRAFGID